MTFLLGKYDNKTNQHTLFGFIEANSPIEAAADPCVRSNIIGSTNRVHVLQETGQEELVEWYLEEIRLLTARPIAMDRKTT